ncbi:MAG: sirohydrochlorin cobaltochelatase, partial [Vallitaleaceae bacterium]|nr:sirohydrochlorin cobaltochelatase [Vallitaleaceae bacterium]
GPGKTVILIGHGTDHSANEMYHKLEQKLLEAGLPILLGTIEEGVDEILPKLKERVKQEYVLMPFLLVAGDHVINDMMGDDDLSWQSKMTAAGYTVSVYAKGLGENKHFQQLYVKRLKNIVEKGAVN